MPQRDVNDLMADLRGPGAVEATVRPGVTNIVGTVLLFLWPVPLAGAILSFVLREEAGMAALSLILLAAAAALLAAALLLRRRALTGPGDVWRIDERGLTVAGVGPLPWRHLGAPGRRMVRSAYSDGQELGWCMPLDEAGADWVDSLDDASRRLFDPSLRHRRMVIGRRRAAHVRLMPLQDVDLADWAAVLEEARRRFTR